jgi:SAM-dependent methyltransferase
VPVDLPSVDRGSVDRGGVDHRGGGGSADDRCTEGEDVRTAVERARAYFERFAAEYDDAARESGWRLNGRLAAALAGVGPVRRAVDLACGTGETLDELAQALPGAELVGVDVAAAMVATAAERVPRATVVRADLRDFVAGAGDGRFDVVTVIGGFEFTPDLPGLLHDVRRVVAPGGHLVFTYEPVVDGWMPQTRRIETNLGSNGLELTTFRWEPGEVGAGFGDWETVRSAFLAAYLRDDVPTVYGWLHFRRLPAAVATDHRPPAPVAAVAGVACDADGVQPTVPGLNSPGSNRDRRSG